MRLLDKLLKRPARTSPGMSTYEHESPVYGPVTLIQGDRYISEHIRNGLTWEANNVEWFHQHYVAGTSAIDVGAFIGLHSIAMSKAPGFNGRVHAFEANPAIYRVLAANASRNPALVTHRLAMGSIEDVGRYSGAIDAHPENPGGTACRAESEPSAEGIPFTTLDGILDKGLLDADEQVSLLKVDVEGYEAKVFRADSCSRFFERHRPAMVVEILGGHDFDNPSESEQRTIESVKALIARQGYRCVSQHTHDFYFEPD